MSCGALQASQQPVAELPNPLMNALASFVASANEPALVSVLVPLVHAVVSEASGAGGATQGPAGKGKAGLFIMLAVVLRTRPQVRTHPCPAAVTAINKISILVQPAAAQSCRSENYLA
jgi:hypothetical protein